MYMVEQLKDLLKKRLPKKPYNNSLGVAEAAMKLARTYGEDEEKAESYAPVEDDSLEQIAFDLFQAKNMDRFDFGENSFALEEGLL